MNSWLNALFNPLNIFIVLLSIAAGLVAAWWLFPLGLLFWLIMVIRIARDPGARLTQTIQNRTPLPQRFQVPFDRIQRVQVSVFNTMNGTSPAMQSVLQPLRDILDQMVDQVYNLCLRMAPMENFFLITRLNTNFDDDLQKLQDQLAKATDPAVKKEYEDAYQSALTRKTKFNEVSTQLERMDAQLASLLNDMYSIQSEIIRLQTMKPDQARQVLPPVLAKLQQEHDQFEQFDKSLVTI
jgi:hypothetical protein